MMKGEETRGVRLKKREVIHQDQDDLAGTWTGPDWQQLEKPSKPFAITQ